MLTPTRKKILLFIDRFIKEQGISPTYREVVKYMGGKSTGSLKKTIGILVRDGYLANAGYRARGFTVLKLPENYKPDRIEGEHLAGTFLGMEIFVSPRIPEGEIWVNNANQIYKMVGVGT